MIAKKYKIGRKPKPHLKIAVDCGSLSPVDTLKGGVHTVTYNLLAELARIDKRNSYILYSFAPVEKKLLQSFGNRVSNHILPKIAFKKLWMPLALLRAKPDVFLATSQAHPGTKVKTLGFVYDIAFLKFPQLYKTYHRLKTNTEALLVKAQHLITISEASKIDLQNKYGLPDSKISVVYPGVSQVFSPKGPKYVDTKKYFLYVGALKKTKNLPTMLEGFALFLAKQPKVYRFVIIGSDVDRDEEIYKTIKRLKLENSVIFKGYTHISELPKYYRGAYAFVSTALYEGFGLPLVEAMASGTPVIAGKNSAMREVVGKAGILVDAQNPGEIATALNRMVEESLLRIKLIKLGLRQAKLFRWHLFARSVLDCIYKYCNT